MPLGPNGPGSHARPTQPTSAPHPLGPAQPRHAFAGCAEVEATACETSLAAAPRLRRAWARRSRANQQTEHSFSEGYGLPPTHGIRRPDRRHNASMDRTGCLILLLVVAPYAFVLLRGLGLVRRLGSEGGQRRTGRDRVTPRRGSTTFPSRSPRSSTRPTLAGSARVSPSAPTIRHGQRTPRPSRSRTPAPDPTTCTDRLPRRHS